MVYILAICGLMGGLLYERSARQADVERAARSARHSVEVWQGVVDSHILNDFKSRAELDRRIDDLRSRVSFLEHELDDLEQRKAKR